MISPSNRDDVRDVFIDGMYGFQQVVTLNPEIVLKACADLSYRTVLENADVQVIDGFGLYAFLYAHGSRVRRCTGVDLLEDLLYSANTLKLRLAYVIPANALSQKKDISTFMQDVYPDVMYDVYVGKGVETHDALTSLKPHVIVVSLGAPDQDVFLARYKMGAKHDCIGIGVGGAVDFLTGMIPRAPQWMQKCGLEWFYRLCREPRRMRRIFNALIVFPCKYLRHL